MAMYKLMVVDDEQLAIESVKYIVDKEIDNIQVVNTARSGREAIEKARIDRPDIVMMDIKMPGINGLDAVREIKKLYSNVVFVMVSAFEYFEFAQTAVELGVKDYLTKPVSKNQLIETLNKITKELDIERQRYDSEIKTREKMEKMQEVVEHSCIYSILMSRSVNINIAKYKEIFDITEGDGYVLILKTCSDSECGGESELNDSVANQEMYGSFKRALKRKCSCIVGPLMLDRVVVYIAQDTTDEYEQRVKNIDMIYSIIQDLQSKFNSKFRVGLGSIKSDEQVLLSYQEAQKALNDNSEDMVVHIHDVSINNPASNVDIFADEQKLIDLIEKGDDVNCARVLNDIFARYPNFYDTISIRNRLVEIMVVAHRIAIENGIENDGYLEYSNYINQILNCRNGNEFSSMLTSKVKYIADKISKAKQKKISYIVDKANKIIDERYNKELSLDDISKELCVSPQYFSRLYKDQMGVNFIEHLTSKRIENAKTLLEAGEHTIKEICFMSGYQDPNYFSRLFKKHVGLSPSAYYKKPNKDDNK